MTRAFFDLGQPQTATRKNALDYDALASASSFYTYVGNDPVGKTDPTAMAMTNECTSGSGSNLAGGDPSVACSSSQLTNDPTLGKQPGGEQVTIPQTGQHCSWRRLSKVNPTSNPNPHHWKNRRGLRHRSNHYPPKIRGKQTSWFVN